MASIGEAAAKSYLKFKKEQENGSQFRSSKGIVEWFESYWTGMTMEPSWFSKIGLIEYQQGVWNFLAKRSEAIFMCFCGWEGTDPVVDAQEVAAREMDVARESQAPDRDGSDRLSEAVGWLSEAKNGRCPKCLARPRKFS
jgi:hypothetical protein